MRGNLLLLSILFVVLAGCGNNSPESSSTESNGGEQMKKELSFETVTMQNAPKDIQATVQQKWLEKSTFTVPSGDDLYIVITRGEMPTGGYSVQVDSIVEEEGQLTVSYYYTDPKKDAMVTQAITKPIVITRIDLTNARVNFKEIQKSSPE
ncbi:protease complex subunit PrcB family protein [Pseudalkalibacillus hwajinpoensis]|uniref:Protease complex subunit PrcB family protein n=1 Tax=Guptibacillus hwajinpoensis TaxID=208199 RepID=A0A4U1MKL9_9BACL|nr:protease complex subunit PrcB family protein [Pseudalkalibacillus hwajinpoensis]TKD71969.1 protease complex subunit PrcB family protein [Pseudalkalibacillus hwajinpoensis]